MDLGVPRAHESPVHDGDRDIEDPCHAKKVGSSGRSGQCRGRIALALAHRRRFLTAMRPIRLVASVVAVAACHRGASVVTTSASRAAPIVSPSDLLTAMHDRYAGQWYHN